MRRYWEPVRAKIDNMSLRERAMIFAAAAFVVIALMNAALLNPLLSKQKILSAQVVQQNEKAKELQGQIQNLLQAKQDSERSPLRVRLTQLKQQLQEQDSYLQSRRDRLVEPEKMAALLEQVLNKNDKLQLVSLKTLPVSPLIEKPIADGGANLPSVPRQSGANQQDTKKQIFKHGVQITVRGGYLEMLRYITALEKMPTQMFWGEASLSVEKYPDALLTLTVYTLSMDKIWLTV
jgi:MSHA biogenesis protein MshJ